MHIDVFKQESECDHDSWAKPPLEMSTLSTTMASLPTWRTFPFQLSKEMQFRLGVVTILAVRERQCERAADMKGYRY